MLKKIVSFGFRHKEGGPTPTPETVVVDVRPMFVNPYRDRALRHLRGTDDAVRVNMLKTPDFWAKYNELRGMITVPGTEVAYIGCKSGHHRSVCLADMLSKDLGVPVEHRDYDKP